MATIYIEVIIIEKKIKKSEDKPIENHKTAAWADIETQEPDSKVGIPSLDAVINAKEWVDTNEK